MLFHFLSLTNDQLLMQLHNVLHYLLIHSKILNILITLQNNHLLLIHFTSMLIVLLFLKCSNLPSNILLPFLLLYHLHLLHLIPLNFQQLIIKQIHNLLTWLQHPINNKENILILQEVKDFRKVISFKPLISFFIFKNKLKIMQ